MEGQIPGVQAHVHNPSFVPDAPSNFGPRVPALGSLPGGHGSTKPTLSLLVSRAEEICQQLIDTQTRVSRIAGIMNGPEAATPSPTSPSKPDEASIVNHLSGILGRIQRITNEIDRNISTIDGVLGV